MMTDDVITAVTTVAVNGARAIVQRSAEQVLPTFILVTDDEQFEIVGWGLDESPSRDEDTLITLLSERRARVAAYICEISLVISNDKSGDLQAGDGVCLIVATSEVSVQKIFVIDRSRRMGSRKRFMQYPGDDMGGLDHSWLQRALQAVAS
jgi:hypothetical protein